MDYDALAKKLGGTEASDQPDYGALAAQYGGSSANALPAPAVPPTDAIPGMRSSIVPPAAQAVLSAPRRAAENIGGFALEELPRNALGFAQLARAQQFNGLDQLRMANGCGEVLLVGGPAPGHIAGESQLIAQ